MQIPEVHTPLKVNADPVPNKDEIAGQILRKSIEKKQRL